MPRLISFVMLVAIIALIGALFFKVMHQFLLPMFLAVLLAVMFRPLHLWMLEKCRDHVHVASLLTTLTILVIVLLPLTAILLRGASEGVVLATSIDQQAVVAQAQQLRNGVEPWAERVGLQLPAHDELVKLATDKIQEYLAPAALGGVQFALKLLVGLAIMTISLFYFLADGPGMVATAMRLSPLDDRYELELLEDFANVSRAVVMATLLSAFVQGLLGGVGYMLVGFESVFLLTALTMLLAMVPFVGAAAVWVPCALWLAFFEQRPTAGMALAAYGILVISMADNVIKPLVLHGQSNLHPLLALLSVLGGVQALGPIGILVGPMLVSFLQALLNMLQQELAAMDGKAVASRQSPVVSKE